MNNVYNIFNERNWADLLQNTNESNQVNTTHGRLEVSKEDLTVKVLDPKTKKNISLNLEQIIQISKKILKECNSNVERTKIEEGLKHLEVELRSSVDKHQLYGKTAFYMANQFYQDREYFNEDMIDDNFQEDDILQEGDNVELSPEVEDISQEVEHYNEGMIDENFQGDNNLQPLDNAELSPEIEGISQEGANLESQLKIDVKPGFDLKIFLLNVVLEKIDHAQMTKIQEMAKEDPTGLFDLNDEGQSFFDLAKGQCSRDDLVELLSVVIKDIEHLNPLHVQHIKNSIFQNFQEEPSYFLSLMEREDANLIFDCLLPFFSEDEMNGDYRIKEQLLDYAYSPKRYQYIFLQTSDLPEQLIELAERSAENLKLPFSESIQERLGEESNKYKKWVEMRRESSSTLSDKGGNHPIEANIRWESAEKIRSNYSISDRNLKVWQEARIEKIHQKLCRGEVGINYPGTFRSRIESKPDRMRVHIVRIQGGWRHFYCPTNLLESNMTSLMAWFRAGLDLCDKGQLNPIIFSAQTYQRFVSLHPFENGNGRVSRMLMDYVLERFHLPPPILGKEILDAVFPLDQRKMNQDQYLIKIIRGIEKSRRLLI